MKKYGSQIKNNNLNLIAIIIIFFIIISVSVDYFSHQKFKNRISANAVSSGSVDICFNNRPDVADCSGLATVGVIYICGLDKDANQTINFNLTINASINTSIFNISIRGIINFTPTQSDVGFHKIQINISDNSNCVNSNNTLLFNLTIVEPPKPIEEGAALTTNELTSNKQTWFDVKAGDVLTMPISDEEIAISEISMNILNDLNEVTLKVARLLSNPTTIEPEFRVYNYYEISKFGIKNNDISQVSINFKVPKVWLESNNIDASNILLYKAGNDWNSLPTKLISSDAQYAYYESTTSGFSTFAIGGEIIPEITKYVGFVTNVDLLKIDLKEHETKTVSFTIKNTQNIRLDIKITTDIPDYITLKDNIISLAPGEQKTVNFDVSIKDAPNIYTGSIFLASAGLKKEIRLIIDLQPILSAFKLKVSVPEQYKNVVKGSSSIVEAQIILMNIENPIDGILFYSIRTLNNKDIVSNEENIYIEKNASLIKQLKLPEEISAGKYIFYASLKSNSNIAFDADIFEVVVSKSKFKSPVFIVVLIFLTLFIIILLKYVYRFKKTKKKIDKKTKKKIEKY